MCFVLFCCVAVLSAAPYFITITSTIKKLSVTSTLAMTPMRWYVLLMRKCWDSGRTLIWRHPPIQSANVNLCLVAEQDHTSPVTGQEQYFGVESTTKQCSRNATCRQWVIILVSLDEYTFPNQVFMISSRDASMLPPNDVCQDTSISFKTMYCLTMPAYVHLPMSTRQCPEPRHSCACPLTNEYQTTSRSYKVQFILAVPAYTHQTTSTKQRLPSNART